MQILFFPLVSLFLEPRVGCQCLLLDIDELSRGLSCQSTIFESCCAVTGSASSKIYLFTNRWGIQNEKGLKIMT